MKCTFCLLLLTFSFGLLQSQSLLKTSEGSISFISEAPLENIKAKSNTLRGIVDKEKNSFAFAISINSFEGFNSPLQQEHFNENYMESGKFPEATFAGKIIEKNAFDQVGEVTIRAKGKLKIHGIEEERIIKCKLIIREDEIEVRSFFTVLLEDHNIRIPKIVFQKIAEEIKVNLVAKLSLAE